MLIDTSGGQQSDAKVTSVSASKIVSNEGETEIQCTFRMTDELANQATYCLERKDLPPKNNDVDKEQLRKNFESAMKISRSKVSLHETYNDELLYLENL